MTLSIWKMTIRCQFRYGIWQWSAQSTVLCAASGLIWITEEEELRPRV